VKNLILVRGVPGSGKTTFAMLLTEHNKGIEVCADEYGKQYGPNGEFYPACLGEAHEWCENIVHTLITADVTPVVVHNTFTKEIEMQAYYEMARKYGYRVTTIIVENRHNGVSTHNVPEATIENMRSRFEVSL